MIRPVTLVAASAALGTLVFLFPTSAGATTYTWAEGLPGCDTSRPAVAHHADQQVLPDQPKDGPVPCGTLTGWPTVENRIEVTNAGAIIYEPAIDAGVPFDAGGSVNSPGGTRRQTAMVRTFDDGRVWNIFSIPVGPETYVLGSSGVDSNLYVDHDTGRLFAYLYGSGVTGGPVVCGEGGGATIAFSDDSGTTWGWAFDPAHNCAENPTILVGKPRPGAPRPSGGMSYPNVVYLCGDNTSTGVGGAGTAGFSCSKSVDGGHSWLGTSLYGLAATKTLGGAQPPVGGPQGFYTGSLASIPGCSSPSAGANVQPLPDGTLLVVMSCTEGTYLAKSTDEGATWSLGPLIPSGGTIRTDSFGNLYKLRTSGSGDAVQLLLSSSTDGGVTWSPEKDMKAPGVGSVGTLFFAQGTHAATHQAGRVAAMYYGIKTGNTTSDGFITETRDAFDAEPTFWSGQVNATDRPLLFNTGTSNIGITILDFIGGAFSPDGRSVWASYVQDCGENILLSAECQSHWPGVKPGQAQYGFAGRLVWPQ